MYLNINESIYYLQYFKRVQSTNRVFFPISLKYESKQTMSADFLKKKTQLSVSVIINVFKYYLNI